MSELRAYGERDQTRIDHLRSAARYLGWRQASALEVAELDEFLLARALEHDSPTLLFRLACDHLISAQIILPGSLNPRDDAVNLHSDEWFKPFNDHRIIHPYLDEGLSDKTSNRGGGRDSKQAWQRSVLSLRSEAV